MCSLTVVLTEDGNNEITEMLNKKEYYVGVDGRPNFSTSNDVLDLLFKEMEATI